MYNIFEAIMVYVYGFISVIVVAVIFNRIKNRLLYRALLSKGKSYMKFNRKGFEVIRAVGIIVPHMYKDGAHIAMEIDGMYIPVDIVVNYGKFNQNEDTEAKFVYVNGKLQFVAYGDKCLADEVHKRFLLTTRQVFISFIGVYIIWYILLKMSGSLQESWIPIKLSVFTALKCL